MPYSNIVFVKLFLSLFEEDDRFLYQLNESQQLLYIKMLYMAGSTNNKITKNNRFICNKINYHHEESCFLSDIKRIRDVFQMFKEDNECYYFEKFEELHNFIPRKSQGTPKELQRIAPEKSKRRVIEDKDIQTFFSYFLVKTKKDFTLTADKKELIARRIADGYTVEHLKKAVDNFASDTWEGRKEHLDLIYCIGKQRGKPDNLEKWLNSETKPKTRITG